MWKDNEQEEVTSSLVKRIHQYFTQMYFLNCWIFGIQPIIGKKKVGTQIQLNKVVYFAWNVEIPLQFCYSEDAEAIMLKSEASN